MAIPIQIMVKNGNAEIVWLLSLDMVPFVTIRYQIRLPILKQPVLIYPLRPFLQPDLSEISHIPTKPGEKQYFWIMKYVTNKQLTTYISLPYGKPCHVALIPEKEAAEQRNSPSKTEKRITLVKTSPIGDTLIQPIDNSFKYLRPCINMAFLLRTYQLIIS